MCLPSIWSSLCLSSSMYRFNPPLTDLAPHDSNLVVYLLVCRLFSVLYIPLFDLVQARPWFRPSMWISSIAGISKTLYVCSCWCNSYVRENVRYFAPNFSWWSVGSKSGKVHIYTARKRSYDWLTASERKWPVLWADLRREKRMMSPKSVCVLGWVTCELSAIIELFKLYLRFDCFLLVMYRRIDV